jgi:hypothetical protein
LAFAGVIIAIFLQSKELRLQREELEATRTELKKSADAQDAMEKSMALTAYLSAGSTLATALASDAGQTNVGFMFHHPWIRHRRLTAHLDRLLANLQTGKVPRSFVFNDREEFQHALKTLANSWEDWWLAFGAAANDQKLSETLQRFAAQLSDIGCVFANAENIDQQRVVVGEICQSIDRAIQPSSTDYGEPRWNRGDMDAIALNLASRLWNH